MIWEEIKNIKSDKKELKKFGLTVGAVLLAIGLVLYFVEKPANLYFISIGAFLVAAGLAVPEILLPLQKAWMALAVILGFIMTRVILSLLFFLVVTPIALVAKIFGKDFLDEKIDRKKESYWHYREKKEYDESSTEKQF
jgi:multisubunit Na+/H+ antiporter MnhG subunit